jgi:hypothetical protein
VRPWARFLDTHEGSSRTPIQCVPGPHVTPRSSWGEADAELQRPLFDSVQSARGRIPDTHGGCSETPPSETAVSRGIRRVAARMRPGAAANGCGAGGRRMSTNGTPWVPTLRWVSTHRFGGCPRIARLGCPLASALGVHESPWVSTNRQSRGVRSATRTDYELGTSGSEPRGGVF